MFDNARQYNPPGNPINALAGRMMASLARHAQRFLRKQLSAPLPPDGTVPAPGAPPRPPGSMPLATIREYTAEWAGGILTRLSSLAPPRKQQDSGNQRAGSAGRRRSSRESEGEEESDGGGASGSGSEDGTGNRRRSASSQPSMARPALPTLPYGLYLNSGRPPLRFMSMPSAKNGGICTVVQLQPELIPDWPERTTLWMQLRPVYVQVPGSQAEATAACMRKEQAAAAADGDEDGAARKRARSQQGGGVDSRTCSSVRSGAVANGLAEEKRGGFSSGPPSHMDAKAVSLDAETRELEAELGIGPNTGFDDLMMAGSDHLGEVGGMIGTGATIDSIFRTLSNPSSLNGGMSLNVSANELGGAAEVATAEPGGPKQQQQQQQQQPNTARWQSPQEDPRGSDGAQNQQALPQGGGNGQWTAVGGSVSGTGANMAAIDPANNMLRQSELLFRASGESASPAPLSEGQKPMVKAVGESFSFYDVGQHYSSAHVKVVT